MRAQCVDPIRFRTGRTVASVASVAGGRTGRTVASVASVAGGRTDRTVASDASVAGGRTKGRSPLFTRPPILLGLLFY